VRDVPLVRVHVGQRDRLRVACEHLFCGLTGLDTDRLVALSVALARLSSLTLASATPVTVPIATTPPTATIVITISTTATILITISASTSILDAVRRVNIKPYVTLTKVTLDKTPEEQLERLDVFAFAANEETGIAREHRDLHVLAYHPRLHLRLDAKEPKHLAHPLRSTVGGLAALLESVDLLSSAESRLNQDRPGTLAEVLAYERPGEFFEGVSPQLLCGALERFT
jgi:hypothetical protein